MKCLGMMGCFELLDVAAITRFFFFFFFLI